MANPVSTVHLNLIDYSGEKSRTQFYVQTIDATTYVADAAFANAIRTAIETISLCNEVDLSFSGEFHTANGAAPTNPNAQREIAIEVTYVDNTNGRKGRLTIPGPDLSLLTLAGDNVALSDGVSGPMTTLVAALQAGALSRDSHAITVTGARVVGRNR